MTPATTALLSQLLPLVIAAVGGWLVRHYNLLGSKTPATPSTPATPVAPVAPAPGTPGTNPLLQAAQDQLVALLEQAVQDAIKRMTPPVSPPKIAG
jgi:hypothetical protein